MRLRAILCITAFILADSHSAARKTYKGPIGLYWGLSQIQSDSIVASSDFKFLDSVVETPNSDTLKTLRYTGTFHGFSNSEINISLRHGRLKLVAIGVPKQGELAISKTWEASVKEFQEKYGKPDSISKVPSTPNWLKRKIQSSCDSPNKKSKLLTLECSSPEEISDYQYWDEKIIKGEYFPKATWVFDNTHVSIMVILSDSDSTALRNATIDWFFIDNYLWKEWKERGVNWNPGRPPDF